MQFLIDAMFTDWTFCVNLLNIKHASQLILLPTRI